MNSLYIRSFFAAHMLTCPKKIFTATLFPGCVYFYVRMMKAWRK